MLPSRFIARSKILCYRHALMLPTLRLIYCCLAWALLGVAASLWSPVQAWWQWTGVAWAVVSLGDLMWMFLMKRVEVDRRLDMRMALGVEQEMALTVRNPDVQVVRVRII